MDRGIPTEAHIIGNARQRAGDVLSGGHPARARGEVRKQWLDLPWRKVRDSVEVKLFSQDGELYVLAKSEGRQAKEIAIRRKKLARLLRKMVARSGTSC